MQKQSLRIILACSLWLLSSSAILAQSFSLSGTVRESTSGEAIIGASVSVYRLIDAKVESKPLSGAYTNKYGFYSIPRLQAQSYSVVIRRTGYAPLTQTVILGEANLTRNFSLDLSDVRMQSVSVQSERLQASAVSTVELSAQAIKRLPAVGSEADVLRALQLMPGVKAANEVSSGLYVRGSSPDQTLILFDGVPVYNPAHLGGIFSTFNADALSDIRLIKGAFPAEYGGRLSSVLDITGKEGSKEKFSGAGNISLISSRLTLEGPIGDKASFLVSGRRTYVDLLYGLIRQQDSSLPNYNFYDLNGKFNIVLSENDRLFASVYAGRDIFLPPKGSAGTFTTTWGNITGQIRWTRVMSPEFFTNISLAYTSYDFTFAEQSNPFFPDRGLYNSISQMQDIIGKAEAQYLGMSNHVVKFGVESTFRTFLSVIDGGAKFDNTFTQNERIRAVDAAVFVQDEISISPELTANIGGRATYFSNGNHFRAEPRASLSYKWLEDGYIRASAAMTHQFIHLLAQNGVTAVPIETWFPSTSTVNPSQALQYVVGVEQYFFERELLVTLEGYYKSMNNLYEFREGASFTRGIPLETQFTSGSGESYGMELFVNKRFGALTGWLGYTLSWSQRLFPELNGGKPYFTPYDRRHDVQIVATYALDSTWEFGATWVFSTGQPIALPSSRVGSLERYFLGFSSFFQTPNGVHPSSGAGNNLAYGARDSYRMPDYHRLDLNATHKFRWFGLPFQLSINIFNVYNRANPLAWQVVLAPVTFKPSIQQLSFFPILPTIGLGFRF